MLTDIWTVMLKEWKEMLLQRPNLRGGWLGLVVMILVFGVFIPAQNGPEWVSSPTVLLLWSWVPFLLVSGVIADSFAGERERHTLETLLASRLSDRAILLGKVLAAVAYGWGLTQASVLLGLVTVNVMFREGGLLLYPPLIAAGILGMTFLVSLLAASLGVLVSLRAATVRQAQQAFNFAFLLVLLPLLAFPNLPDNVQSRVSRFFLSANFYTIAAVAADVLLVIDLALLALAAARFRRSRLILD